MTYTFRLMRKPGAKFPAYAAIPIEDAEDGGLVRGMLPNSKEELMVARALDAAGLNYDYQVPLQGGRSVAGGLVLDFLVYAPYPTPVPIMGGYYHKPLPDPKTSLYLTILQRIYRRPPVTIDVEELTSQEAANAIVRERLL